MKIVFALQSIIIVVFFALFFQVQGKVRLLTESQKNCEEEGLLSEINLDKIEERISVLEKHIWVLRKASFGKQNEVIYSNQIQVDENSTAPISDNIIQESSHEEEQDTTHSNQFYSTLIEEDDFTNDWTDEFLTNMSDVIASTENMVDEYPNIECRSNICRTTTIHSDQKRQNDYIQTSIMKIFENFGDSVDHIAQFKQNDDGKYNTLMYIVRRED